MGTFFEQPVHFFVLNLGGKIGRLQLRVNKVNLKKKSGQKRVLSAFFLHLTSTWVVQCAVVDPGNRAGSKLRAGWNSCHSPLPRGPSNANSPVQTVAVSYAIHNIEPGSVPRGLDALIGAQGKGRREGSGGRLRSAGPPFLPPSLPSPLRPRSPPPSSSPASPPWGTFPPPPRGRRRHHSRSAGGRCGNPPPPPYPLTPPPGIRQRSTRVRLRCAIHRKTRLLLVNRWWVPSPLKRVHNQWEIKGEYLI